MHSILFGRENDIFKSKFFFPICGAKVSISSAERIQKEGGKPGERAPSKKGKEKGKEVRISIERSGSQPLINAMLKTLLRCGFLEVLFCFPFYVRQATVTLESLNLT